VKIRRLMNMRMFLSFGATLAVTSLLIAHRDGPPPAPEEGVVFVYFPSMCAAPGDASDCHEMTRSVRPAFQSMTACFAHADQELARMHDPRVLASCLREKRA
jgi:hypothetical protein